MRVAIVLLTALLGGLLTEMQPAAAASRLHMAAPAKITDISAQARVRTLRPRPRIRVTPLYRYPYRTFSTTYPVPYPYEFPGPGAVRQCGSWLAAEYRPSGTVIVPKMRCWWER